MKFKQLSITVAAMCLAGSALAAPSTAPIAAPKFGMVYDAGGKFDKSFNQSAFEGLQRFSKETGVKVLEVQANSDTQAEQVMRGLARKKVDLIAAIGFSQTQAVQKVAREFPNVRFVLIDSVAQGANIELGDVQGAGRLVPGRRGGGHGLQDQEARLCRRHGHSADPRVRLRLRPGRQGAGPES